MVTPIASPIQKPRKLWPPWRLPGKITNASEELLESASESAERWSWGSGALVIAGVLGEIVLAIAHMPYDSFRGIFCSISCDVAIAVGVAAEIGFAAAGSRFQSELTRRSKSLLAEVMKTAFGAEYDVVDLKAKLLEADRQLGEAWSMLEKTQEELGEARKAVKWLSASAYVPPDPNDWKQR